MITRIWHGRTRAEDADSYLKFLQEKGIIDYLATQGNLSVRILRKIEKDVCHFYTVTEWQDVESIKKFAGDDYERAKYYPEDEGYLMEFEETVNHYETFYGKEVNAITSS